MLFEDDCKHGAGAAELGKAMPAIVHLDTLRLARCSLRTRGVAALAAAIASVLKGPSGHASKSEPAPAAPLCALRELDLQHNGAGVTAAETLAAAVATMEGLQTFLFAGNRPACEGITALATALATRRSLQVCV